MTRPRDGGVGRPRVAADLLLHPVAVGALVLLVVNDHVGKAWWPGVVTGKASDVAGVILAPLVAVAVGEVGSAILVGRSQLSDRLVVAVAVAVSVGFVAIQVIPAVGVAYQVGLGTVQGWIGLGSGGPVRHVMDATDLLALPAVVGAAVVLRATGRIRACPRAAAARPRRPRVAATGDSLRDVTRALPHPLECRVDHGLGERGLAPERRQRCRR